MNQDKKGLFSKIFFFAVITIALIILLFSLNDINEIVEVLKDVNWLWLLVGIGFLLLYIILNPISLYLLSKKQNESVGFGKTLMIGTIEYFFNGITPFSSGGQPFQVLAYNKVGVKPHKSTGILLMNFVVFQLTVVLLCIVSMFYIDKLAASDSYLYVLIIAGFLINFVILVFLIAIGVSNNVRRFLVFLITKIFKMRIFKGKLDNKIKVFEGYCDGVQATFKGLLSHKWTFVICLILKAMAFIFYYMIPFFILKALNIEIGIDSLVLVTAMTIFAIAMTCYFPTPGAAGGIEFAFQALFINITASASAVAVSGVLLWRFITYYLLMAISLITYIIFNKMKTSEVL